MQFLGFSGVVLWGFRVVVLDQTWPNKTANKTVSTYDQNPQTTGCCFTTLLWLTVQATVAPLVRKMAYHWPWGKGWF